MDYTTLGRTGLRVSVAGLGCGGHSRLGLFSHGMDNAAGIVRRAHDLGVNFFDTAYAYGTHGAVAKGLEGIPRDKYVLSSKFPPRGDKGDLRVAGELEVILDESLRELRTDHIDIWHLHAVEPNAYEEVRDRFVPQLLRMREKGKIRFLGITEGFASDTRHDMLQKAVSDNMWDVMMVGRNILNPSASYTVLPKTASLGIGTLCMFAVRFALSNPDRLRKEVTRMLDAGQLDPKEVPAGTGNGGAPAGILDFLVEQGYASSIPEAAYRVCRHEGRLDVILTGTSSVTHLEENLNSLLKPALPMEVQARLERLFGRVDCVSGQ